MEVINLGWCIAKIESIGPQNSLTIMSPSAATENSYTPAESVTVYGDAGLIALRDALNAALEGA